MAGYSHDRMGAVAHLGQSARRGFTKTVSRTMHETGLIAPFAEPISETGRSTRRSIFGHDKCQVVSRQIIQDFRESRVNFQPQKPSGFLLPESNPAVADMLPSQLDDVAPPLGGVELQAKCEPRLCADRVPPLERCDFVFPPGMET